MSSGLLSRILVPYDGSKYSNLALKKAIEIAKDETKIDVINVVHVDYIRPPGALLGMVSPSSIQAIKKITASTKKEAGKMVAAQVSKCRAKGIKADSKVLSGDNSEQILKYAKQKKSTLIVIGSHGLHGIKKLKTLGSTSRNVSEHADCPVLMVR